MKSIIMTNPILGWLGLSFLLLSVALIAYLPFNEVEVLGLNSMVKPLKFSVSIWIYSWTMAIILTFLKNEKLVRRYSWLAVITMLYEQLIITAQAFRGELSHFNETSNFETILFGLMGVFITLLTIYTLRIAFSFMAQKDQLPSLFKKSIVWGLVIFVIAGFIGGFMGYLGSHSIGGEMGGAGITFFNWSLEYGDLRVAHFIGLHAIQVLPLAGWIFSKPNFVKFRYFSPALNISYLALMLLTFWQAVNMLPFISNFN